MIWTVLILRLKTIPCLLEINKGSSILTTTFTTVRCGEGGLCLI